MRCYHCAEPVTEPQRWQVEFDNDIRDVCCAGCKAVMQAIVDSGLGDYYRFRTEPAQFGVIPDDLSKQLDELKVFDEPEISERYLHAADSDAENDLVEVNLSVEGLRCGACVWVLERSVSALTGVDMARVNFSSARATVRFNPQHTKLSRILGRVAEVGYRTVPFDARERELALKRESRVWLQRLFVAGIAMMQVMMYALPAYISESGEMDAGHEQLLRWAALVLTTPVLLYSAQPFLRGAYNDLLIRKPGMDVPVSIGILAAFIASVWATLSGQGEIYFDSVAMFVFLLLGARYLEWAVRRRAIRAVDDISSAAPETAQRVNGDDIDLVPASRLEAGDCVIVNNGDRVPVDGVVLQGQSAINNALVTGESIPVAVGPGDIVAGGALLAAAPIRLTVLRRQSASTLSVIDRLIDRGACEKPLAVQISDRVATLFVTVLLGFALLVWLVWMVIDSSRAATTAIAVLVVSCPCALSLATPAALAAATGELLKSRLLITRGHALETLSRVTDVVFDKTGTLTTGKPEVISMHTANGESELKLLDIAVAMEIGSSHPYASALRQRQRLLRQNDVSDPQSVDMLYLQTDAPAALRAMSFKVSSMDHQAGHGVGATIENGSTLYLGSAQWCGINAEMLDKWRKKDTQEEQAASEVFLTLHKQSGEVLIMARFVIKDALRDNISELINALKQQGLQVHLLSGDRHPAVEAVADELKISNIIAMASPSEKQAYVRNLQASERVVLMVGDGINDAPVLASADVSMAAGDATALARTAADVISLLPGLNGLLQLLKKATQTKNIVRQNLTWAASYNALAIPLAGLGLIPPWAAAIGMALSSLLVAANAQRLWSKRLEISGSIGTTAIPN